MGRLGSKVKVKVLAMGWAEERSRAAAGSTLGTGGRKVEERPESERAGGHGRDRPA